MFQQIPFLGVHKKPVFDCRAICRDMFEEDDSGANIGGIRGREKLEVGVVTSCRREVVAIFRG